MLTPGAPSDCELLRQWITEGAQEGAFDSDLAGAAAVEFASMLQAMLGSTVWPSTPPVRCHAWLFRADDAAAPAGFGIIKAGFLGPSLWMLGLAPDARGHGLGRQLIAELLATPAGQLVTHVAVRRVNPHAAAMLHMLQQYAFSVVRLTHEAHWLVSPRATREVRRILASAPVRVTADTDTRPAR